MGADEFVGILVEALAENEVVCCVLLSSLLFHRVTDCSSKWQPLPFSTNSFRA